MIKFYSFHGIVTVISDLVGQQGESDGCNKLLSVQNDLGAIVNFVISPSTYFVEHAVVAVGDKITGYYDGNAPALLIYPPQYLALIVVKESPYANVKVDYFDSQLISSDGQLRLNISPYTKQMLTNNQPFSSNLTNRNLIVIYGPATKSIPSQTTPYKIIVWC